MDGVVANLPAICDLADRYDALVMVDDSHATGFMGRQGRGTHEHHGVMGRIDILTGTLGKALGGASGGYTSGRAEIVAYLRQRSRPYLFSNTLAPAVVGGTLLAYLSDRSGWWNLERIRTGERAALHAAEAEFGYPAWTFGSRSFAFLGDGRIVCAFDSDGFTHFGVLDPESGVLPQR